MTLFVLHLLLMPVVATSRALRDYVLFRRINALPTTFQDDVGTLMSDTTQMLNHLEHVRDTLENYDMATGLPNRAKFLRDAAALENASDRFATCVVRFSNHSKLVDTFDLKTANLAATEIAARIARVLRDGQALYRVGAGDFVWLARDVGESLQASAMEVRMREIVKASESALIGVAERSGLIHPIGLWVLRTACLQMKEWNVSGMPNMKVAVNLSARQFLDVGLTHYIAEAIADAGIDPSQLEIELTETSAMADHAHTRAVFTKLRDSGVNIAIDDFGSGYASMSYLRKLPFDKLKIDREFVTNVQANIGNQAICRALVALAEGLGLNLLAEGTEKAEEVEFLQANGCDLFQGFYFSKPLPAATFKGFSASVFANRLVEAA